MAIITTTISPVHSTPKDDDLEVSPISPSTDPYSLQTKLIPREQLTTLRQRGVRRKVRKFYEDQNANIEAMLKSVDEHRLAADAAHEEKQLKVQTAGAAVLIGVGENCSSREFYSELCSCCFTNLWCYEFVIIFPFRYDGRFDF